MLQAPTAATKLIAVGGIERILVLQLRRHQRQKIIDGQAANAALVLLPVDEPAGTGAGWILVTIVAEPIGLVIAGFPH